MEISVGCGARIDSRPDAVFFAGIDEIPHYVALAVRAGYGEDCGGGRCHDSLQYGTDYFHQDNLFVQNNFIPAKLRSRFEFP